MSAENRHETDTAPGDEFGGEDIGKGLRGYFIGLVLASLLTAASFAILRANFVWAPAIPVALLVFAIAQMGVHLRLLSAHHHRAGQHEQRDGPGLRRPDRHPSVRGLDLDHEQHEPQHDAADPFRAEASLSPPPLGHAPDPATTQQVGQDVNGDRPIIAALQFGLGLTLGVVTAIAADLLLWMLI